MRAARFSGRLQAGVCPGGKCPGGCSVVYTPLWTQRQTPSVNRMTDKCKNITLPQTSFAGLNYSKPPTSVINIKLSKQEAEVHTAHMC